MDNQKTYKAFISYRRSDCTERAQLIKKAIISQGYSDEDVFLDFHSIHEGEFPHRIKEALNNSEYFILLISNDSFGKNVPNDYFYEEIRIALELQLKIIPIIFDNIDINTINLPLEFEKSHIRFINGINYSAEYQEAFEKRLSDFMNPGSFSIKRFLVIPSFFIGLYLIISLISGIALYIHDNYFLSPETQIETVINNLYDDNNNNLIYVLPNEIISYNVIKKEIKSYHNNSKNLITCSINYEQTTTAGFWAVASGLVYEFSHNSKKIKLKGKSFAAYCTLIAISITGIGLGCTWERMLFPVKDSRLIQNNIRSIDFWKEISKKRERSQLNKFKTNPYYHE